MAKKTKNNDNVSWTLVKFFKHQTNNTHRNGKVVLRGKTPNGFLEKIFELGTKEYVFDVQIEPKNGIIYSISIGQYSDEKAENEINKSIAEASKNLLPLLQLLQKKEDGKHLEDILIQEHYKENNDNNCDEPPTLKQFTDYCLSLISKHKDVHKKEITNLFAYFKGCNWKLHDKPMKDWRVGTKILFLLAIK